ncbi:MAG: ABC transporter permease [Gammaproteobacteria bacterium]|nr:MAG: ABC transporter permease [Gammaproteobacteria bacterium]RLA15196.1 MAG: ABC transporter permease [Gammaproteobacteria bacterium]
MTRYLLRRLLYAIPILLGVNLITFSLFFVVNTPDDMAYKHLGDKRVTVEMVDKWKKDHGYDRPLIYAADRGGFARFSDTLFAQHSLKLFLLDFGRADDGRSIGTDIRQRMGPSLAIAIPNLLVGLLVYITVSLTLTFFRGTYIDFNGVLIAVAMMSISAMFYIIAGQFLLGKLLHLAPISGYQHGIAGFRFLITPVLVGLIAGLGGSVRWYRTLFLEEIEKDYIRSARARGLGEAAVLWRHLLRNALIPILTGVVVVIPTLFMGSLITESFFSIPGLGSYTIDAIRAQDFAIVRAMVFLGSLLYIAGLMLTDLSYVMVDPRVRLE